MQIKLGEGIQKSPGNILRWAVLALVVGIVIWGFYLPSDVTVYWNGPYTTINDDWVQKIDGQDYVLEVAQECMVIEAGEVIALERTILLIWSAIYYFMQNIKKYGYILRMI